MESGKVAIDRRIALRSFSYTVVFNTLIALFLTVMEIDEGFVSVFILSQCIGLSICAFVLIALHVLKPARPTVMLLSIALAIIIGSVIGTLLGSVASGIDLSAVFAEEYGLLIKAVIVGLLFGVVITYFFVSRERIAATEALIQEERIKRLTSEKGAVEKHLRLLQAQIEPHFLFNTLSNVLSLLETDAEKGKAMLVDFTEYLRTSLSRMRDETTTVAQEMDVIQKYLDIYKVRMGDRLRYRIDIPEGIRDFPLAPLLVQPLVENAIRHGLEPEIDGGEVIIRGAREGDNIRLEVMDTGPGFSENSSRGIGIDNIKERLRTLYGEKGRLIFEENKPSGLKAVIEIPYERDQSHHRR